MNTRRRSFLLTLTGSALAVPLCGFGNIPVALAASAGGTKLDPQDPAAKNLNYTHRSANANRQCRGCQFYTASDENDWGSCVIFPDKLVSASGVCNSWYARVG